MFKEKVRFSKKKGDFLIKSETLQRKMRFSKKT